MPGRREEERMYERYVEIVQQMLAGALDANRDSIVRAAAVLADTVERDGIIHAFGSGHSQLLAQELEGRAGGFAPVNVIYDPGLGKSENVPGYAASLLRDHVLAPPDCLVAISNSGRNTSPVEMALIAKEAGLPVIALTALDFSRSVTSRHSSGRRLFEVADVVLDNRGVAGDAVLEIAGAPVRVGPTSTIVGAMLLGAAVAGAVAELVRRGVEPPIIISHNTDHGPEYEAALRRRYRGRLQPLM
jgi:uncharacterized phosphosugar-binding protein